MSNVFRKAQRIYHDEGGIQLFKKGARFAYNNYVRSCLPRQAVSYNGIPVRAAHLGDSLVPWQEMDIPGYEDTLIQEIRQHAEEGDSIVIVGGGWGVSTVVAANQVGRSGSVTTFEGSREAVKKVDETVSLNHVANRVVVQHAVVAHAFSLRGEEDGAQVVSPDELPECDILVLDCEGAEVEILEEMSIKPECIIVETHGMFGATEEKVTERLVRQGYQTTAKDVAETRLRQKCEENGIYVLTANHTGTQALSS